MYDVVVKFKGVSDNEETALITKVAASSDEEAVNTVCKWWKNISLHKAESICVADEATANELLSKTYENLM